MKIAYVIDRLDVGGAEKVCIDLANLMSRDGHQVHLVTFSNDDNLNIEIEKDINVFNLNRKQKYSLIKMYELSKYLKNIDIVHVHMRHVLRYVVLGKKLFSYKAKLVFHDHFGKINVDKSVPISLKISLKNIDAYIGVDTRLCDWAFGDAGVKKDKIWKLPNIVRSHHNEKSYRAKDRKEKRIIVISNFKKEKNISFSVLLIEKLLKKSYAYTLDIYGHVTDKKYFQEIKELIKSKNLKEQIHLVTDCSDPRSRLFQYDLALHTAVSESGPLVLMEYLSEGLPFLAYKTGEVVDTISKELPELILGNFDEREWVDKITTLENMNSQQYSDKLKNIYNKHFSEKEYVNKCNNIYNAITNF